MESDALTRKLAAILYADVAGYSRLTGGDEEGTHRKVMALLDYASEAIGSSGGTVLRYAGDALLAEFSSVITAVKTAITIQSELASQNASIADDEKVQIRIGINIGDVIEDRGEVFGDGVNLAARLESAAPAGGICVSSAVHEQLAGKIDAVFSDDGPEQFKNISRPVQLFRWTPGVRLGPDIRGGESLKADTAKPSIAVLALANMNNDSDLDFIGDGITEDLITALSKIHSFKVISRESTFSYKNTAIDVRQVAKELDVRYILEGSVRKTGSRIRVTAQLVDAETGHHVWAERYDREMEDIFDLQDEMVQIIAGALEPELNAVERERAVRKSPENLDAWELYQRALWFMWSFGKDSTATAIELFRKSIESDPDFALSYAYLAYTYYITVIMGYADDPKTRLEEGLIEVKKALKRDDKDAIPYFAIGRIQMLMGNHDASIASLEKSIELNPCFAQSYHALGFAMALAGRLEESKQTVQKAIELSPKDPLLWAFTIVHALILVLNGEDEAALEWVQRTMLLPRTTGYWTHAVMAAAMANLDRMDEARAALAKALKEKPNLSIAFLKDNMPTKYENGLEPYLAGLRKAGLSES